jgi:hypothetical protein
MRCRRMRATWSLSKRRRGPLTGISSPQYDPDTPWQTQQTGRFARGFFARTNRGRQARLLFLLIFAALLGVVALSALWVAVFG